MRTRRAGAALLALLLLLTTVAPAAALTPTPSPTRRPVGTRQIVLHGNLDARAAVGKSARVTAAITDSLRRRHFVRIIFVKAAGNSWDWAATTADGDVATTSPLAAGAIAFDENGVPPAQSEGLLTLTFRNGATPVNVPLRMELLRGYAQTGALFAVPDPTKAPRPVVRRQQPTTSLTIGGALPSNFASGDAVSRPIRFVDSLGALHELTLRFVKGADDSWDWDATTQDPDIITANPLAAGVFPGAPSGALSVSFGNGAAPASLTVGLDALASRPMTIPTRHNRVTVTGNLDSRMTPRQAARVGFTVYDGLRTAIPITLAFQRDAEATRVWHWYWAARDRRAANPSAASFFEVSATGRPLPDDEMTVDGVVELDDGTPESRLGALRIAPRSTATFALDMSRLTVKAAATSLRATSSRVTDGYPGPGQ